MRFLRQYIVLVCLVLVVAFNIKTAIAADSYYFAGKLSDNKIDIKYSNNDNIRYFVGCFSGNLYEFNLLKRRVKFLLKLPLDEYDLNYAEPYFLSLNIDKTANNNLLIDAEICDRNIALTFNAYSHHYIWLSNIDNAKSVIAFGDSVFVCQNNIICLADKTGLAVVNDKTGVILRKYSYDILSNCNNLVWSNGQYILLNNYQGNEWLLLDCFSDNLISLGDKLLSKQNREKLIDLAELPDAILADVDSYWQTLGCQELLDPHPELQFVCEENGVLFFHLVAVHSMDNNGNYKYLDIEYKLN